MPNGSKKQRIDWQPIKTSWAGLCRTYSRLKTNMDWPKVNGA